MKADNPKHDPQNMDEDHALDNEELSGFDEFDILERLESLREDMEELGVTTLTEVIQRITEMHERLDRQ